ncbi:epoxyalkane--coenzyme M transferase [Tabrizicola sp. BL-A-41-H6]|uniref:epoxyalkane--coenzyme M transferase n=1 Tax=Tabrizicola sp. BL-A-41-H6 TaxID=3421107 RepID=UPI003D666690
MKSSTDRILTTHTGSLPRTKALSSLLVKREQRKPFDKAALAAEIDANLDANIKRQAASGVDIGNDGETPRVGFSTYTTERMTGFGGESLRKPTLDAIKFPGFADFMKRQIGIADDLAKVWNAPQCVDRLTYDPDLTEAREEADLFQASLKRTGVKFTENFMSAASPGIVSTTMLLSPRNPVYKTDEDYVMGIAKELKKEYDFIVSQGYVLQLDAPDLAMERVIMYGDQPLSAFLDRVALHIEAINVATADIPRDRVRLHVCWGNWNGPHQDDVDMKDLLPLLYKAKVGALSIPVGNPRHEHEVEVFRTQKLPDGMLLIPGVIDVTTNYLEHPEVVANRICAAVSAVGDRERVIAGTDCGFGTFASYEFIAEDIVWAKLEALSQGAAVATKRLWK